jgi:antitoxin MazE
MKKNLTAIGSSLGLIIDKPIAELYQLDRNTVVEITPKEDGLNIRFLKEKAPVATDDEVMRAASDINKRYQKMMKNLAK